MRVLLLVTTVIIMLFGYAYALPGAAESQIKESKPFPSGQVSPHGVKSTNNTGSQGMVAVIQNAMLADYKNIKIGEVVSKYSYFKKKVWSETRGENGKFYVDFFGFNNTGWFDFQTKKKGISAQGVEVKFVIFSDGSYGVAMVSRVEVKNDGGLVRYPLSDKKKILDAIYNNREIGIEQLKGMK